MRGFVGITYSRERARSTQLAKTTGRVRDDHNREYTMTDSPTPPPPPPPKDAKDDVEKDESEPEPEPEEEEEEEEEEDVAMPIAPVAAAPAAAAAAAAPSAATVAAVAVAAPAQTGGGKRSPSDFLKTVLGRPVVVKLNSGIDYRGERRETTKCTLGSGLSGVDG